MQSASSAFGLFMMISDVVGVPKAEMRGTQLDTEHHHRSRGAGPAHRGLDVADGLLMIKVNIHKQ